MKSARRLYGKNLSPNQQQSNPYNQSAFFKSKVNRKVNPSPDNDLGPGQYQISLPLVRPNFQTIHKNNNTFIIKFNNSISSSFDSKSPRFKYPQNETQGQTKQSQPDKQTIAFFKKYKPPIEVTSDAIQQEQKAQNKLNHNASSIYILPSLNQEQQIKSKIKQNLSKKKSKKSIRNKRYARNALADVQQEHKNRDSSTKNNTLDNSHEIKYRTLPITARLHHLEPNMFEKKKLNSNRYKSSNKTTQWSKYKEERKSFVENSEQIPGPGSYKLKEPKFKIYKDFIQNTSWQFNSTAVRNPFNILNLKPEKLQKIVSSSLKYDFQDSLPGDSEQKELKKRFLARKRSRDSISNFHPFNLQSKHQNEMKLDLSLQFTAIHSRQNLIG